MGKENQALKILEMPNPAAREFFLLGCIYDFRVWGGGGSLKLTYFNQFSYILTLFTMYCVSEVEKTGF